MALCEAERQLEERQSAPLAELQHWLQLTYELEQKHFDVKRETAERQLLIAKEMVSIGVDNKRNADCSCWWQNIWLVNAAVDSWAMVQLSSKIMVNTAVDS